MQKNSVDKRILKTRSLIKTTVAKMLTDRRYETISVADVAKEALIQRATFYHHYSDVGQVLSDICTDIAVRAENALSDIDFTSVRKSVSEVFTRCFNLGESIEPEYMDVLRADNELIVGVVRNKFIDNFIKKVEKHQRPLNEYEKYAVRMFVGGVVDAYVAWGRAHASEKRDVAEFIAYASKVADNACAFLGVK